MPTLEDFGWTVVHHYLAAGKRDSLVLVYDRERRQLADAIAGACRKKRCKVIEYEKPFDEMPKVPAELARRIECIKGGHKGARFFISLLPETYDGFRSDLIMNYVVRPPKLEGFHAPGFTKAEIGACMRDKRDFSRFSGPLSRMLYAAERAEIVTYGEGERQVLSLSLRGRHPTQLLPFFNRIKRKGYWTNLPPGAVNIAPREESAEGTFISNSFPWSKGAPLKLEFKKGRVANFEGDTPDSLVKRAVEFDEGSGTIGELVFGTNTRMKVPKSMPAEKVAGVVGIAIGRNDKFENPFAPKDRRVRGKNRSKRHLDFFAEGADAYLYLKGEEPLQILRRGKLNFPLLKKRNK